MTALPAREPSELVPAAPAAATFSTAGVLGRSFALWWRNVVPFYAVSLVVTAPAGVFAWAVDGKRGFHWLAASMLVWYALASFASGVLAAGVVQAMRGERPRAGLLLFGALANARRLAGVAARAAVRITVGDFLLLVPGVVARMSLFVAMPVAVLEPEAVGGRALERSRALTRGRRWHLFLVWAAIASVGALETVAWFVLRKRLPPGAEPDARAAFFMIAHLVGALLEGWDATARVVAYRDLRLEKEGVDPEELGVVFE